jgi:hypothetical protein
MSILDTTINLTTVQDVINYLGRTPTEDSFWIYYTGANATATVQVNDSTMVLIDSVTTTLTFADADKDTITELVAYINASVSDWIAGVIGVGAASSSDLVITGALNAKGETNKKTLKINDIYLIESLINSTSALINRYTGRTLKSTTHTNEKHNGEGFILFTDNYPITAIVNITDGFQNGIQVKYTSATAYNAYASVSSTGVTLTVDGVSQSEITFAAQTTLSAMATAINAVSGWTASVPNSQNNSYPSSLLFVKLNVSAINILANLEIPGVPLDCYHEDLDRGQLRLPSGYAREWRNVFITYTAGYTTIPADLVQLCNEIIKLKIDQVGVDSTLKREVIGDVYEYERGGEGASLKDLFSDSQMATLSLYVRRSFE